jgi:mono/diheme cytochrome c family protein
VSHEEGMLAESVVRSPRLTHVMLYHRVRTRADLAMEAAVQRRVPVLAIVSLVLISVFTFAQTHNQSQSQQPTRPVDGPGIFKSYCAACHGTDARGGGPVAKALKRDVPDLTALAQRNNGAFPAIHARNTLMFGTDSLLPSHGSQGMPIWGPIFHEIEFDQDLGNVRMENLVKYLESIQRK